MVSFCDKFAIKIDELEQYAAAQPMKFRQEAWRAYKAYTRPMRAATKSLKTDRFTVLDFFLAWQGQYQPRIQKIQTALEAGKMDKMLTRTLLLTDSADIPELVQALLAIRRTREIQALVDSFYHPKEQRLAHEAAMRLMRQPDAVMLQYIEAYTEYGLYREAAKRQRMTVVDAHANIVRRPLQRVSARRQVRRLIKTVTKQLVAVDQEMLSIEQADNGLIKKLFTRKIDLVEILAARQEYEKALEKMHKSTSGSPSKQMLLYEKATVAIRERCVNMAPKDTSLKGAQQLASEVNELILEVFEMDVNRRNELMRTLKQYRFLTKHRAELKTKLAR